MAAKRVRQSAESWRALLAQHAESGLSVAAFCARAGVSAASFYQWRSRLGRAATSPVPVARRERGAFVDLGALAGGGRFELRLDLGGGLVLQLSRS